MFYLSGCPAEVEFGLHTDGSPTSTLKGRGRPREAGTHDPQGSTLAPRAQLLLLFEVSAV